MNNYFCKSLGKSLPLPKAFSLTEIILTVSIFLLLAGVGMGAYFRFYEGALINSDVDNALTLLKNTRFKALKNPTTDNYGIHIDNVDHKLTSFRDTYTPGLTENVVVELGVLEVKVLNLDPSIGVTDEILFEKNTGKTQNTGDFRIGTADQTFIISTNAQGVVNLQ